MDSCVEPTLGEIQRLRDSAWKAIGTSTVDGAERTKYWSAWTAHCAMYSSHSNTQTTTPDTDKLLTFAVAVWEGKYGRGTQVKVQSVKKALRHVAQKLVLDGHPDPRKASPAQESLDLPISRLLRALAIEIPRPSPSSRYPSRPSLQSQSRTDGPLISTPWRISSRWRFSTSSVWANTRPLCHLVTNGPYPSDSATYAFGGMALFSSTLVVCTTS